MANSRRRFTREFKLQVVKAFESGISVAELTPRSYEVTWDASRFASGVYFYRLHAGSYKETKKLVLMR